ncbi:DNA polymerase III subunit epsilon [Pseudomonas typographi]|uniref:DNA polymerase III subunit epsilon n=1 Tax=Pseudomonas typographi TaxID=2715964 RepID=A0ABR7Z3V4_9PSED|nr:DNA polymerase III subunit epsilon [Pseudomonas typographi]MBD1552019.1 DNA polymerase III subunit epsilon [Pseudomonas typographi]MBD1586582.1 DNA polymerase III subunit epsilon [Pseudomonas typographi]MBD1600083.1 DNA polymerase III subunit epsilon [Pseudomonas typographi]
MAVNTPGERWVVLDTETTGMPVTDGHRVLEIGCVEVVRRRLTRHNFHVYLQADRESDDGAIGVHGITSEFLRDKPRFADIADEFYAYIHGATLIIHNATFDIGFLNNEFALLGQHDRADISQYCTIIDSLAVARARHPGQRNSLDALCKRYGIDLSERTLHGALLDSELLADVYLAITGGQTSLSLAGSGGDNDGAGNQVSTIRRLPPSRQPSRVIMASEAELAEHAARLEVIAKAAGGPALWAQL